MKNSIALICFLLLGVAGIKAQDKVSPKDAKCAVLVDFASPGSGIDLKTYEAIKKILDDNKLKYTEVGYGREGETYFCLQMKEVKRKRKKQIIKELKSTAKNGQFTSVSTS